jgi:2,3-bisphosphoglycerate-independent phosphoglycerate mutase
VTQAKPKTVEKFFRQSPHATLAASGETVGLLRGQEGNSEAGHQSIGAGRIVPQDVLRVNAAIENGTFFKNPAFREAIQHVRKHQSRLHLMGLLTNGQSAHAYPEHLYALLKLAKDQRVGRVVLHLFTDGRDTSPHDAPGFLEKLQRNMKVGERVGTIMGRYYAMERSKRWEITEGAFHALTQDAPHHAKSAQEAILQAYNRGETDEFIHPSVIGDATQIRETRIQQKDSVIFFNLRSDRARQITKAFVQKDFNKRNPGAFRRRVVFKDLKFVAMTDFGPDLPMLLTAFPAEIIRNTLPMMLSDFKQHYIAESQKYAHMTFFINGGYSEAVAGEKRTLVPSPRVRFYDRAPRMSLHAIQQVVRSDLKKHVSDFIAINVANPDMIGHTGNLAAAKKAIEACDAFFAVLARAVEAQSGILMITADHGNAEEMINLKTEEIDTEHSTNPVPFLLVGNCCRRWKLRKRGILADIAPTILEIFGIRQPREMTGRSLILKSS